MGNTPYEWCVGGSIRATYLRRDVNGESDEIHMVLCNRSEWSGNGSQKVGNTCKSCCEGISIDRRRSTTESRRTKARRPRSIEGTSTDANLSSHTLTSSGSRRRVVIPNMSFEIAGRKGLAPIVFTPIAIARYFSFL